MVPYVPPQVDDALVEACFGAPLTPQPDPWASMEMPDCFAPVKGWFDEDDTGDPFTTPCKNSSTWPDDSEITKIPRGRERKAIIKQSKHAEKGKKKQKVADGTVLARVSVTQEAR